MHLFFDPEISSLEICFKKYIAKCFKWLMLNVIYSDIIYNSKNWVGFDCSSIKNWFNKLWYILTMKYYAAMEKE